MPRGVYVRKPKKGALAKAAQSPRGGADPVLNLLGQLRVQRTKAEDRVVAIGTAIEALEVLDER